MLSFVIGAKSPESLETELRVSLRAFDHQGLMFHVEHTAFTSLALETGEISYVLVVFYTLDIE